jgi:hypothetical protein
MIGSPEDRGDGRGDDASDNHGLEGDGPFRWRVTEGFVVEDIRSDFFRWRITDHYLLGTLGWRLHFTGVSWMEV